MSSPCSLDDTYPLNDVCPYIVLLYAEYIVDQNLIPNKFFHHISDYLIVVQIQRKANRDQQLLVRRS